MTSESSLLQLKLDHAVPALESASRRAWDRPDADRFREYLAVCHMATRATVPLLEFAVAECRARPATDGVAARLVSYYLAQIEEERGHDAALLDDFTAAGGDPSALLRRVPRPEIAALVGAQYYWVRHSHPVALVGHMAVLEGYPPRRPCSNASGTPPGFPRLLPHPGRAHRTRPPPSQGTRRAARLVAARRPVPLARRDRGPARGAAARHLRGPSRNARHVAGEDRHA